MSVCLGAASPHEILGVVLAQLAVIIASARLFAAIFRWFHQPSVVGEVLGGIVLGPSLLKPLAPELWEMIFRPELQLEVDFFFSALKEIGLMFLLFVVGMEFDFSQLRKLGKPALLISIVGIVVPFGLGTALAPWIAGHVEVKTGLSSLSLFLGTALAITALPVLGRILMELGITRTKIGTITISAAAANDAAAWIILASIVSAVQSQFDLRATLLMIAWTLGFSVFMIFLVRPLLRRFFKYYFARTQDRLEPNGMAVVLVIMLLCGLATLKIGIFAIFGAFLLGACLSGQHQLHRGLGDSLRNFIAAFFLPIFFTYTGLRTDIGSLATSSQWLIALVLCAAAIVGKLGGCLLTARWCGFSWREAGCIGALMNTRGLMELIVINVGYEMGILDRTLYTILVMMAILTTVMTTPLLIWLQKGTELEPCLKESGFLKHRTLVEKD